MKPKKRQPPHMPLEDEIAIVAADIRMGWSDNDYYKRAGVLRAVALREWTAGRLVCGKRINKAEVSRQV